jgi:hypothetical protein
MSIWANVVKRFKAPSLPKPQPEYDRAYFDALVNILRLYFNQLDNLLEQIVTAQPVSVNFYGGAVDAFGRARFSEPFTLFDSQSRYDKSDDFDESTATGGTVTYLVNESTTNLNVTTSNGSEVVRQTKRSFSYQPGKSLLTLNTFVMGAAQSGIRMRVGYFNTENGVFFERNGSALRFVRRSFVTGSAVDTIVEQADWNGDKLNGTGDSGFTIDLTKAQILWEDFEWLGVGAVRCGFVINGQTIVCHTFYNANNLNTVYMTTAILPVRYEVRNTTGTGTAATLKQICSTVISEGGYERKVALSVARRTTSVSVATALVPLVSIRLAAGRSGAIVVPDGYSALGSGASAEFEIVLLKNPTLTGASWVASSSANVQEDTSATALTGGTIIRANYTSSGAQAGGSVDTVGDYNWDLQLGSTISGTSDIYTLAARTLGGTHTAIGSLSYWDLT